MSFGDQPVKQQRICDNCGHSETLHIHESYQWNDELECEEPVYECDMCDCTCFVHERESQSSQHCDMGWMNDVRFGD